MRCPPRAVDIASVYGRRANLPLISPIFHAGDRSALVFGFSSSRNFSSISEEFFLRSAPKPFPAGLLSEFLRPRHRAKHPITASFLSDVTPRCRSRCRQLLALVGWRFGECASLLIAGMGCCGAGLTSNAG